MFAYYTAIKHAHILFVVITMLLFNFRYFWLLLLPNKALYKSFRIMPHINDTLLLISGISLAYTVKFIPFMNANWLGIKLILLIFYIVFGFIAIKSPPKTIKSMGSYVCAILSISIMTYLAMYKPLIKF